MTYKTNSSNQTKQLAQKLAQTLLKTNKNIIVALQGDLGSGKTTFTQGFAKGLGVKDKIISPTFILIRQHQVPKTKKTLYHLDLYRLENLPDINELGILEILQDPESIVLIEWAEKIKKDLPKNTININFKKLSGNDRTISLTQETLQ